MRGTHLRETAEGGVRTQEECNQVRGTLETAEGGHAKCFGVGVLEIIKASEGIVGGTKGCSVNKVGALGVFKKLAQGDLVVERGKSGCGTTDPQATEY